MYPANGTVSSILYFFFNKKCNNKENNREKTNKKIKDIVEKVKVKANSNKTSPKPNASLNALCSINFEYPIITKNTIVIITKFIMLLITDI